MNLDDYVKVVGDYADQIARAEKLRDQDTIAVAEATFAMFDDKASWVDVGLQVAPLSKQGKSNYNQIPDTMSRFHLVTNALLREAGREHEIKSQSTTESNIHVGRALGYIPRSERSDLSTVRQVLPLRKLLNSGDVDRIPEAVRLAKEMATDRGARVVAADDMRKAASLVKSAADKQRRENATIQIPAQKIDRLRSKLLKAEHAVSELFDAIQAGGDPGREIHAEWRAWYRAELDDRKKR